MTDKLIELIKEYGKLCGLDRGSSYDILTNKQESELNDSTDKAKQAIIDYHDKKVRDATKHIRETCERYKLLKDKFRKYNFTEMDAKYYYDILDELVKAIKQTIANVDGKGESDG